MQFQGKILPALSDTRDFSRWSVAFMQEFREVEDRYKEAIEDNVLTFEEIEDVIRELKDVLGALVCFYVGLDEVSSGKTYSEPSMDLLTDEDLWMIKLKKLPQNIELAHFQKWFSQLLETKVRKLFSVYLEALADNEISEEEKLELRQQVVPIIKEIIYVIVYYSKRQEG